MPERTIIHGGTVLSLDRTRADQRADILVEDGVIAAIETDLSHIDGSRIDATGQLVLPGLIDTHRHTWQSLVRGICADWTLADYFFGIRLAISPAYTPADVCLGNRIGALDAINAGVTTLLDFSHCNNTPDHSDGAVEGLLDSGIRAAFCYGFFESSPGQSQFGSHADRIADFGRIADTYFPGSGLLSLGVSLSEIFSLPPADTRTEIETAREHGALMVNHSACVWGSDLTMGLVELGDAGLLGSDMVHVHNNALGDREWELLADSGGKVSISVETELNMGMGRPVFERCRQYGLAPTLSADVISLNSGDLWNELRFGLGFERWDASHQANLAGRMPERVSTTARDALDWCTINAADALGLTDQVGSLTVGKRADIICVGGHSFEQHPMIDPYGTLVFQTTPTDVRTVLIDGQLRKQDGQLVGHNLAQLADEVDQAADEILGRIREQGRALPGTPDNAWEAVGPQVGDFVPRTGSVGT